ncbi:hypothetical protein DFH08DRAFT_973219 [Mycena albidolilacea]|uniref:Uncharacterized protein n=1 Tax=Mycena albidolilacea TaxID=1033008 RepID=A0AAD6Z9T2_9AGAR|nr:hypothetical protein DFH08DRAFT_973219 [Mycena albidolilacea]
MTRAQDLLPTQKIKKTLSKILGLSFAIIHSTTLALPAWKRTCLTYKLLERLIPRDSSTVYRRAVDAITAEKSLKLRKFELDEQEWKILSDLLTVLRMYKAVTLAFSTNSISTIANGDKALHPAVCAATEFAKNCLNKYWFNADDYDVYRIAMILHPGMKLKYFRKATWAGEDYIQLECNLTGSEPAGMSTAGL